MNDVHGEGLCVQGALGVAVCGVGAFLDAAVASLIGADPGDEVPLYVTAAGR